MNRLMIGLLIAILLIAIGIGVYFLLILPRQASAAEVEIKSSYTPGEYFVTNIKDSNSLVKIAVVLEVDKSPEEDPEFFVFLEENNHIIRDTMIFLVRDKTYDQLTAPDVRATLSAEFIQVINENLKIDNVKAIYFNDFVVQ